MTNPMAPPPRVLDEGDHGALLLYRARGEHPTVAWWWGRRMVDGAQVAWCYVCDRAITPWIGTLATWPAVMPVIDAHRIGHLAEMRAEINPRQETA